jgi:hypothetical protein
MPRPAILLWEWWIRPGPAGCPVRSRRHSAKSMRQAASVRSVAFRVNGAAAAPRLEVDRGRVAASSASGMACA